MKFMMIVLIRFFSGVCRCLFGSAVCRHVPGCSEYAETSIRKRGMIRGAARGLWRLLRCHPFGTAGLDLP